MIPIKLTKIKYGETWLPASMAYVQGSATEEIPISLLFYLVEYADRKMLVDVGCDEMGANWKTNAMTRPVEMLSACGLHPEDITDIILTHSHEDHIGAITSFLYGTVYIQQEEFLLAGEKLKDRPNVITFTDAYTLDDMVSVHKIGGHSVGSSVVHIRRPDTTYVLAGDECYVQRCLDEQLITGASYNADASIAFLQQYKQAEFTVCLFHDVTDRFLPGRSGFVTQII